MAGHFFCLIFPQQVRDRDRDRDVNLTVVNLKPITYYSSHTRVDSRKAKCFTTAFLIFLQLYATMDLNIGLYHALFARFP